MTEPEIRTHPDLPGVIAKKIQSAWWLVHEGTAKAFRVDRIHSVELRVKSHPPGSRDDSDLKPYTVRAFIEDFRPHTEVQVNGKTFAKGSVHLTIHDFIEFLDDLAFCDPEDDLEAKGEIRPSHRHIGDVAHFVRG